MRFCEIPFCYFIAAIAWSVYQGWRGYREQRLFTVDVGAAKSWNPSDKFFVLYLHDFMFRFICTVAGFVALRICYRIAANVNWDLATLTAGGATLLAVSFLIGVIGVGGQLHTFILLGKGPNLPGVS